MRGLLIPSGRHPRSPGRKSPSCGELASFESCGSPGRLNREPVLLAAMSTWDVSLLIAMVWKAPSITRVPTSSGSVALPFTAQQPWRLPSLIPSASSQRLILRGYVAYTDDGLLNAPGPGCRESIPVAKESVSLSVPSGELRDDPVRPCLPLHL
jgi:hypothetical protein